jgi:hypothetical protein
MKLFVKRLGLLFLVFSIFVFFCACSNNQEDTNNKNATSKTIASVNVSTNVNESDITKIALNAATKYFGWNNASVSKIKNLYDFNDSIVAYNVDICNNNTNKNGYIMVSNFNDDEPIIQMSENSNSIYDKTINTNDECIYDGVGSYFAKNSKSVDNNYYEISSKTKLTDDILRDFKANDKQKVYKSANEQSSHNERQSLSSTYNVIKNTSINVENIVQVNNLTNMNGTKTTNLAYANVGKILQGVLSYNWYLGCTPTSACMALEYDYGPLIPDDYNVVIQKLAYNMGTTSSGGTHFYAIPGGICGAMYDYGIDVTAYNGGLGRSGSTFSQYMTEINNNHPTLISVFGCTLTSPSYTNGYGNHTLCGIGYRQYSDGGQYLIAYDTSSYDGQVWLNYNSSGLGNILSPMWTYIH